MEKEKIINSLSGLRASEDTLDEVYRLMEVNKKMKKHFTPKKIAVIAAIVTVVLILGVSAYAFSDGIIAVVKKINYGWSNNVEITRGFDKNGEAGSSATVSLDELVEPVEVVDGRMYFIANGLHTDITDLVSETQPYFYSYTDQEGVIHYMAVGLLSSDIEDYGYGEYLKDGDTWLGGYAIHSCHEDDANQCYPWYVAFEESLDSPYKEALR